MASAALSVINLKGQFVTLEQLEGSRYILLVLKLFVLHWPGFTMLYRFGLGPSFTLLLKTVIPRLNSSVSDL